ncbi:PepSY-associated TM helix domain-containing protein [Amycolatopsis pithecellobii]|uniref:PepSY domain-containing protein n=1 Tax=Amycolatopsis pithecellobii TaxID=664692 RepID=A0A6N7YKE2_9PSEU|nr:PepSY domain-containing protein [Amycolatopsis pithecellobii]MTD53357.1 PepSY domain-containing protein [Amycolatopsis pithecellobii]
MTTTVNDPSPAGIRPPVKPGVVLRMLARRVHFLAGLAIAPFLMVLCLSGLVYAFTPQINDLLYSGEFFVDSASGPVHSLADQVQAALAAYPQDTLSSVIAPDAPDRTTQIVLSEPGLGGSGFSAQARTVYVDPYTGHITGDLITTSGRPPAQQWLRDFHGNLQLGDIGRLYSEFVASWLPFVVLGGLILWIGMRRRKRRLRALLLPQPGAARARAWHGPLGLWLAIGLLAVSITGLTWSNYAGSRVEAAITAVNGKTPSLSAPEVVVPPGAQPISIDTAVGIARAQGIDGQLTVTPPARAGKPFKVSETGDGLPIRKDEIAIDPYTQQITARLGWPDYPPAAKLTTLGIQAHSGTLLGLVNEIAMALLALGTLALLVLGYRMWWKRRRGNGKLVSAPPSVWRHLSRPVLVVGVLIVAALCWAMPVFGGSLVLFLVLDTAISAVRRRAATP